MYGDYPKNQNQNQNKNSKRNMNPFRTDAFCERKKAFIFKRLLLNNYLKMKLTLLSSLILQ